MRSLLLLPLERLRARAAARLGLLVLVLAVAGCRVDATVETRVEGRGGVVSARFDLDREAVAILGGRDTLADGAQVTDLRRAGWTIGRPRESADGGARVSVSKRFERPEDLATVVAELSGPEGPLSDFRLVRHRRFASTRYQLSGRADLRNGAGATGFGNAGGLAERLKDAGVNPVRVEELLTARAVEGFGLRVVADLPGDGDPVAKDVPFGEMVELVATAQTADRARPVLLVIAAVLAAWTLALLRADGRLRKLWRKVRPPGRMR